VTYSYVPKTGFQPPYSVPDEKYQTYSIFLKIGEISKICTISENFKIQNLITTPGPHPMDLKTDFKGYSVGIFSPQNQNFNIFQ